MHICDLYLLIFWTEYFTNEGQGQIKLRWCSLLPKIYVCHIPEVHYTYCDWSELSSLAQSVTMTLLADFNFSTFYIFLQDWTVNSTNTHLLSKSAWTIDRGNHVGTKRLLITVWHRPFSCKWAQFILIRCSRTHECRTEKKKFLMHTQSFYRCPMQPWQENVFEVQHGCKPQG